MIKELIAADQKEIQVIIFKLGNEEYATPIANIQEIIIPQTYTRIPKSPDFILGVINLRGNVIPVIDGRKKFSLDIVEESDETIDARIMIMDTEEGIVGLVVDNVSDVILLKTKDIEPPPLDLGENNEIVWGLGRYAEKLLILINCKKGLSLNNHQQIKDLQNVTDLVKKTQN